MQFRTSFRATVLVAALFIVPQLFGQEADFGVSKLGPATAAADTDVTYTVQVVNAGPDAADVQLNDIMPAGMTFVSFTQSDVAFLCTTPGAGNNGTITCTNATMLSGATATFTFTMHIPPSAVPGDTFNNQATVSTSVSDPNGENNTATASTTVPSNDADAGVLKTGPSAAAPGSNVTYTITAFNAGPSNATSVQLNDTLPGTMTFVSLSQSGPVFNCTTPGVGSGGTITCDIATLTVGSATTFTLTANIPGGTPDGTTFNNTATIESDVDPNPDNNAASSQLTVTTVDPAITKSGPPTATGGQTISYTIALVNNGSDTATNVHWLDTLPPGTTFNALIHNSGSTFNCQTPTVGTGGTIDCFLVTFGGGATANYTLVLNIDPSFANGATLTNTAAVSSDSDINQSNNSSSTSATVAGVTDVSVTKSGPASANAGSNISWTITVTNNGANAAANTSLTDTLPPGTSFVSLTQNSGPPFNCSGTSSITCTNASFAAGATATFTLVASTSPSATGTVSNTANVSTTTGDTNSGNDTSTANTTLASSADVAVTKSGPPTAVQNQDVSYAIGVKNNGPSDAQSVSLNDTIPAQATFVSITQNTGPAFSCSGTTTVTCSIATLTAGAAATFTLTVHTNAAVSGGMVNTANVSSTTSDPNSTNNSASAATNLLSADVAVTKNGSPATVAAGSNVTWTIVVTNNGPNDASTVTMTDALPANTTFVSLNQSGPAFNCTTPAAGANGPVTCTIATLTNGSSTTFTLVAKTDPLTPAGTLSNTATVASTSPFDPTPGNNTATSQTTVALVDLSLTKTLSPGPYVAGQPVTFTLTVTNNGAVAATNVVVTDTLPAGMFATSTTPPGACTGTTTVTCTAATLAGGASTAFTITATLPATPGNYTNTATVTSANGDSAPGNNTGSANFAVVAGPAIPTLDPSALLLFAALLGIAAVIALRR